jgi:DNA polymerase-3 subunit delta
MILFLFGQDTYRSHRKLEEIRAKFLRDVDTSGANVTVLDGASAAEIRPAALSRPFLAGKRLVVAKNSLKSAKKAEQRELADLCKRVPDETILTFFETAGSEDLSGNLAFEVLKGGRYYPEFTPLPPREAMKWISEQAEARGASFERDALERYAAYAGNDLWKVSAELDKLSAHARASGSAIDLAALDALAELRLEASLFDFLDAVGARRTDRAAGILDDLLRQGETEVALLNRLQGHFRNLLVCAEIAATGRVTKDALTRELGIHPFVASKTLSQARYFGREELRGHYAWLIDADEKLKLGGWPKPRLAIDLFLMRLAGEKTSP